MRMRLIVCSMLTLAACTGEKPAPATPNADSAVVPVSGDSAHSRDTTAHRGDSVMARDTASGI